MVGESHNPFRPGLGTQPPYLAGREDAVSLLKECLSGILHPTTGDGVVLFGPHGSGKTALLNELRNLALEEGVTVRHLSAQALDSGVAGVCHALLAGSVDAERPEWWAKAGRWKRFVWWAKSVWRAKASPWQQGMWWARARALSVTSAGNMTFEQQAQIESVLRNLLKEPLLLTVDEAQEMPEGIGKYLLQAVQQCIGARLPLLLVLAGTPSVKEALGATHASFWERLRKQRVGRLESEAATRDALAIPAKRTGLPFDEDALDLLVRESQHYPYFVQVLGKAAWKVAKDAGHTRISLRDAEQGIVRSARDRQDFYAARAEELEKKRVIVEAKVVSKAMMDLGENPRMTDNELQRLLDRATSVTGNTPENVREEMSRLGLLWRMPSLDWEPGIPSFCDYIARAQVGESGVQVAGWGKLQQAGRPGDSQK